MSLVVLACDGGAISNPGLPVLPVAGTGASAVVCPPGVDLANNPMHCGQCGVTCGTGTCASGQCICPSTLTKCPGGCMDIANDDANCGACGRQCAATERCQQNQCLPASAVCTPACGNGQICSNGVCKCPETTSFCGGACVDPQTTPQHCGACDMACMPGQLCQAGQCVCPPGQMTCDGQCADIQISPQHCGACGKACAQGEACMAGVCRAPSGADGCSGPAQGITIKEVAVYQSIKIPVSSGTTPIAGAMRAGQIIQNRPTLFRVFVTPGMGFAPRELSARVTLKNGNGEDQYFAKQRVTKASTDGDTASTFQITVPRERILADTRYSVELVECGTATAAAAAGPPTTAAPPTSSGSSVRMPAMGDVALEARDTGTLKVRIIPLMANSRMPDTSEKALTVYRNYLEAMYPVDRVELIVGKALNVSYPINWNSVIEQIRAQRQADRPTGDEYYYGFLRPTETLREYCQRGCTAGVGFVGSAMQAGTRVALGLAFADEMSAATMAHEVGHNHGRGHAPCAPGGQIQGVDSRYPYMGASTGVWGYDSRTKKFFNPQNTSDIMGYCDPKWISDYTYKGLTDRSGAINTQALELADPEAIRAYRVLLLDAEGPRWSQPFPEPAAPYGTPEDADVLDIDGNPLERVIVYRTQIGDSDGTTVLVPEPEPGWHSIKLNDALPHAFSAPVTVPDPQ